MTVALWRELQRPLTKTEMDDNFWGLDHRLTAVEGGSGGGGGVGPLTFELSPDGASLLIHAGISTTSIPLPSRPIVFKGGRVVGATYSLGDVYTAAGSSYIVLQAHNAAAAVADDVNTGKVAVMAVGGQPFLDSITAYSAAKAYKLGDLVLDGAGNVWLARGYPAVGQAPAFGSAVWAITAFAGAVPASAVLVTPGVLLTDFYAAFQALKNDFDTLKADYEAYKAAHP